ncbi:factor-independent urate hydroxylase [Catellatospora bangladeshensis]|uniref:Uricase n=1 Tax=Catellatospora bangladeshensis TaxID=310355 RepID=A0A8J3JN00_9ACTN|nr:urate oxidase [Catellatospora bangladeshensis]GIF81915.1 uricase [Catellatospora bangladeshensis]
MAIHLGPNRYGKAECRLVAVARDGEHTLTDLNVSTRLAGRLDATHLTGDNSDVLPTDTQKNTVYAFARRGVAAIEEFGLDLARHFVAGTDAVERAQVHVEAYGWRRLGGHSFARAGDEVRTATLTATAGQAWAVGGLHGLTLLNTTGSEFRGFPRDRYTTLPEASDRILATAVDARWRFASLEVDWDAAFEQIRGHLIAAFVETYSRSLQQTLYAMGERVLAHVPEVAEVRLALPNRHHFLVDLSPFGLDNPDTVYFAADRPYGLIEGTVQRDDAPEPGLAWDLGAA